MSILMLSGAIAFITSVIGLLPQIYKTLKTKSTKDLSMLMLMNYLVCSFAWIVYGKETGSVAVLASNILGFLISFSLIGLKYHYDKQSA